MPQIIGIDIIQGNSYRFHTGGEPGGLDWVVLRDNQNDPEARAYWHLYRESYSPTSVTDGDLTPACNLFSLFDAVAWAYAETQVIQAQALGL